MINIIKRNLPFVIFCLIALIVIGVLSFLLVAYNGKAVELESQVEEQKNFFRDIRRKDYPVTEEGLELIQENAEVAKNELAELRRGLAETSQIDVESLDSVEAKNRLVDEVDRMTDELEDEGVTLADDAAGMSFSSLLEGDELPDEETEVPVILKQLQVIEDVVQILAATSVNELQSLERPFGLEMDERNYFSIMPIELSVAGDARSIREFVSALQNDAEYLFFIDNIELTTANTADNLIREGDRDNDDRERRRERRPESRADREDTEGEDEEKSSKKVRRIPFSDMVDCNMRISFVEFHAADDGN
ncbi:MAG: hypothetical protein ACOCZS_03585 [Verrucomicrobiota bacterium]